MDWSEFNFDEAKDKIKALKYNPNWRFYSMEELEKLVKELEKYYRNDDEVL